LGLKRDLGKPGRSTWETAHRGASPALELGVLGIGIDIHTSLMNEVSISGNWHTEGDGSGSVLNRVAKPLSAKRGAVCEKFG